MQKEINKLTDGQKKTKNNTKLNPGQESGIRVGSVGIVLITVYLILFSVWLFYSIVKFWPPATSTSESSLVRNFIFFGSFPIRDEVRLLVIVALAGALGSLVHALRSFYWYVGHKALVRSWLTQYILLPFVGATLALAFFLVIRGGFFSPEAEIQQTSPFGFAALAVLVGMFSEQAVLKLKDVANTLLTKPKPGANAVPEEKGKDEGP